MPTGLLSANGNCQQVVDDAMVKRIIGGLKPGRCDTVGYCKARTRLPLPMISTLAREVGAASNKLLPIVKTKISQN